MRSFILTAILFCTFISNAQEKIYVPYFESEGCSRQTGISTAIIFADYVNKNGKFKAELAAQKDTNSEAESFNDARESAELISSKYFIMGRVIRIDKMYYIKVSLYASSSGNLFWSSSRTSAGAADLPLVIKDMANRVAEEDVKGRDGDLFLISRSEGRKVNRVHSNKSLGFITGVMFPMSEEGSSHVNPGFGGVLSFDARDFIFETTAEVYFGSDSLYDGISYGDVSNQYLNLSLNAIYPFSTRNSTPFVSLSSGLSYRKSEVKYSSPQAGDPERDFIYDQGLFMSAGGGYILKRNTDATLFIYARGYMYMMNTDRYIYGAMLSFSLQFELSRK